MYQRICIFHSVHGSEAVGSFSVALKLHTLLLSIFRDVDILLFGPLSAWCTSRSFRFDYDFVDTNRVFAKNISSSSRDESSPISKFASLWFSTQPSSEAEILEFLYRCDCSRISLDSILSQPQSFQPGLPGYCLSPHIHKYELILNHWLLNISLGLPTRSRILLVDVHLGIGEHARTSIIADEYGRFSSLPNGSFLGEMSFQLRQKGFITNAFVTETGCVSNLHGLLCLLLELSHRTFSSPSHIVPLKPLIDSSWISHLEYYFVSDFYNDILPILCQEILH